MQKLLFAALIFTASTGGHASDQSCDVSSSAAEDSEYDNIAAVIPPIDDEDDLPWRDLLKISRRYKKTVQKNNEYLDDLAKKLRWRDLVWIKYYSTLKKEINRYKREVEPSYMMWAMGSRIAILGGVCFGWSQANNSPKTLYKTLLPAAAMVGLGIFGLRSNGYYHSIVRDEQLCEENKQRIKLGITFGEKWLGKKDLKKLKAPNAREVRQLELACHPFLSYAPDYTPFDIDLKTEVVRIEKALETSYTCV